VNSTIAGAPKASRLSLRQAATVALLVTGYTGYYFCRSNLSVCTPLIRDELTLQGMTADQAKVHLGTIVSLSALAYAVGKILGGGLTEFFGGRRSFLGGMVGSILFTIMFASGGALPIFTIAWIGNRFTQSFGWLGIVRVVSRWFPHTAFGTVMGIISLSFLFGDALSRKFMMLLLRYDFTWREVFHACAGVLAVVFVLNLWLLRETPGEVGEPEPEPNPENLYGEEGAEPAPSGLRSLFGPLLRRRIFWYACLLSLGLTFLRETLLAWIPTYFNEALSLAPADAADKSALFPLFGGISVLVVGVLSDRLGRLGRASILVLGLMGAAVAMAFLAMEIPHGSRFGPVAVTALIGFLLTGPYSFLAGAIALDLGGKKGSAAASGFIDAVGYLGGAILAGQPIARVAAGFGWNGAFVVLAIASFLTGIIGVLFFVDQRNTLVRLR